MKYWFNGLSSACVLSSINITMCGWLLSQSVASDGEFYAVFMEIKMDKQKHEKHRNSRNNDGKSLSEDNLLFTQEGWKLNLYNLEWAITHYFINNGIEFIEHTCLESS